MMRVTIIALGLLLIFILYGCSRTVSLTPDIEATVESRLIEEKRIYASLKATAESMAKLMIEATRQAIPTATPTPVPTATPVSISSIGPPMNKTMFLSIFQSILLNRLGLVTVTLHSGARWDDDESELFINVAPDEYDETKEVKLETIECDDVFDVVGEVTSGVLMVEIVNATPDDLWLVKSSSLGAYMDIFQWGAQIMMGEPSPVQWGVLDGDGNCIGAYRFSYEDIDLSD